MVRRSNKEGRSKSKEDGGGGSVDTVLANLEQVVEELEAGDLPLEQALERFEHGVRLARQGGELLTAVEEKVEVLLADRDDPVAFDDDNGDRDDGD